METLNIQQYKRIEKLKTDEFYFLSFQNNEILMSGSTKNVYRIIINENKSLTCDCPDSKSHAKKQGVLCKHICFIYIKICKSTNLDFFATKKLTDEDIQKLNKNTQISEIAKKYYDKYISLNNPNNCNFDEPSRELEDDIMCPICFDDLIENIKTKQNIKFCPDCSNAIHQKCIDKWFENKNNHNHNCVFCRSDCWSKYGNKTTEKSTTKSYVNLK